jgi:alkylation response protein AidB-like acyl-CoA dehydrogenase
MERLFDKYSQSDSHQAWRNRIRAFFAKLCTVETLECAEEDTTNFSEEMYRALVDEGLTAITIPVEYGGLGLSFSEYAILSEEAARAWMPHSVFNTYSISAGYMANALLRIGTEEQRRELLPKIIDGSARFALGLTEPDAGSDLAAITFRATLEGDDFVLDGEKTFQSARHANHMLVVARTDSTGRRHRGISLIVADLNTPGITYTPLQPMWGYARDSVRFEEVRQPRKRLLGRLNEGWSHLMSLMDLERSGSYIIGELMATFEAFLGYTKGAAYDDQPLIEDTAVTRKLADLFGKILLGKMLSQEVQRMQEQGIDATLAASVQKIFNTELKEELAQAIMDMTGPLATIDWAHGTEASRRWSPLKGLLSRLYRDARTMQIAGGTSEIQRNIIARRGLGLPDYMPTGRESG